MPRAFLIARRRYNGNGEFEETGREYSPERGVHPGEYSVCPHHHAQQQQPPPQPQHQQTIVTSDGASECDSSSSETCPDELYNLTKLAEVSLAAAAGTLLVRQPAASLCLQQDESQRYRGCHRQPLQQQPERTRIFLERIEAERESLVELQSRRVEERLGFDEGYKSDTSSSSPPAPSSPQRSSPDQQQQQQQQDSGEEHECPDCGKRYSTSSNLARHRQTHRSLGDKKARRCPHCDKVYVSIPAYSMHVRTHNQGCKCHYCGKCFSRPWLLQGHIRTHTGEKPFKCTICNKAFADKSNLRAHIQTHSSTKPHVCARCGKAFALKSYLYKHEESSCMRSHHGNSKRDSPPDAVVAPQQQQTSSPTSVIVPPRQRVADDDDGRSSAIVRHTVEKSEVATSPAMVIRTSVISPNPEHLRCFGERRSGGRAFDLDDPTRLSAFSRPQPAGMTLNLAVA